MVIFLRFAGRLSPVPVARLDTGGLVDVASLCAEAAGTSWDCLPDSLLAPLVGRPLATADWEATCVVSGVNVDSRGAVTALEGSAEAGVVGVFWDAGPVLLELGGSDRIAGVVPVAFLGVEVGAIGLGEVCRATGVTDGSEVVSWLVGVVMR